jgi:hypothetical protein
MRLTLVVMSIHSSSIYNYIATTRTIECAYARNVKGKNIICITYKANIKFELSLKNTLCSKLNIDDCNEEQKQGILSNLNLYKALVLSIQQ